MIWIILSKDLLKEHLNHFLNTVYYKNNDITFITPFINWLSDCLKLAQQIKTFASSSGSKCGKVQCSLLNPIFLKKSVYYLYRGNVVY